MGAKIDDSKKILVNDNSQKDLIKIGDVYLSCSEKESLTFSTDSTDITVESGAILSDTIQFKPIKISISGIMVGEDGDYPQDEIDTIVKYMAERDTIDYVGVQYSFSNCTIDNFEVDHSSDVANGATFTMDLKVLSIADKQTIETDVGTLDIPDIEAIKDQMEADKEAQKQSAKVAAGIRVYGSVNAGRQGKTSVPAKSKPQKQKKQPKPKKSPKSKKQKQSKSVIQQIIDMYG